MAKKKTPKHVQLTSAQKDEIRRLTQLANRRIKAAEKEYRKAGKRVLPTEVVGQFQIKEQWNTKSTPLSRSVKFESLAEYKKQLKFLQSFDPKARGETRPTISQYANVQQQKTIEAVETSLDLHAPEGLQQAIRKMNAPQLADFWKTFSNRSAKLGLKYSSAAVMQQTLEEYFPEDLLALTENVRR